MFRKFLLAAAFLIVSAGAAAAQNVTCPTRPTGDSTNACASTAFVQGAVGSTGLPATTDLYKGTGTAGQAAAATPGTDYVIPSQLQFPDLTGNIAVAQMNSGTGASSTTFWRGDGTWATPASASGITVGTTTVTSGTNGYYLYDNGGVVGNAALPTLPYFFATAYGTVCDGSTDDTTHIQNAINAASSGGTVVLPRGTCVVATSLSISNSGTHLVGQGTSATLLDFTTSTLNAQGIILGTNPSSSVCTGSVAPSNCQQTYNTSISQMSMEMPNGNQGFLIYINGASQTTISDLYVNSSYWFLYVQFANTTILRDISAYSFGTTGYAIYLYQPITTGTSSGWYRSDVLSMNDVTLNANAAGTGCFDWDGMFNTVRMKHVALLDCSTAFATANTQNSSSYYPTFLFAEDLEIDGTTSQGVQLNAGADFHFVNSDIDICSASSGDTSNYPFSTGADSSYSVTHGVWIVGSAIHCSPNGAAYINSRDTVMSGDMFYDLAHNTSQQWSSITFSSTAVDGQVTGSFIGRRYGDPDAVTYGVNVNSGASGISLTGNNYDGATSGSVINGSGNTIGFVGGTGYNNSAISVTTCAANSTC